MKIKRPTISITMTTPDMWVMLRIKNENETFYKILAGFRGGYLSGDSWRLNSGITKADVKDKAIDFHGYSGSIYTCNKDLYGTNMLMQGVIESLKKQADIKVMPKDTKWNKLNYGS